MLHWVAFESPLTQGNVNMDMIQIQTFLQPVIGPVSSAALWLGISLGMLAVAIRVYTWITRYDDFGQIRNGNAAVAISLSGTIIGLALPLHSMIIHNSKIADLLLWGAIALVMQVVLLLLEAFLLPNMRHLAAKEQNVGAGVLLGTISAVAGYLLAACITP
jgi:putative membrane protein